MRQRAFQTLYLLECRTDITVEQALLQVLRSQAIKPDTDDLNVLYRQTLPVKFQTNQIVADSLHSMKEIVQGVQDHLGDIDKSIGVCLINRSLQRVETANLVILRIAVYELLFTPAIPTSVVMNEAIELTKQFNDELSSKFVNGILQSVVDSKYGA